MPDDRLRLKHLLDQSTGILAELVEPLATYYRRLVDAGIPPEQAIQLVRDVQARYIGDGRPE